MGRKLPAALLVGLAFVMLCAGCAQPGPVDRDLNAEAMRETSLGRWEYRVR